MSSSNFNSMYLFSAFLHYGVQCFKIQRAGEHRHIQLWKINSDFKKCSLQTYDTFKDDTCDISLKNRGSQKIQLPCGDF